MADVIRLQDRQNRSRKMSPPTHRNGTGHDATILLFTGIRYERLDPTGLPKAPTIPPLNGTAQKH